MEHQRQREGTTEMAKRTKKLNTELLIDGENIGSKKAKDIMKVVRSKGALYEGKVYGRQCDAYTKAWSQKAKECGISDIRLYGGPEKNKVDNKLKKDARNLVTDHKNIDIVYIATNDGGYVDVIKDLRSQGKRVVVMGTKMAARSLREACSRFVEI